MKDSNIEWCDHTFNPWEGCTKVSPGCAHCYAEARNQRFNGGKNWGKGAPRRRTKTWGEPVRWNKQAENMWSCPCGFHENYVSDPIPCPQCKTGIPARVRPRVFCASLADWLDDEVPIEWLADLLKLIHDTPNLDWLLLTKRPENWAARVARAFKETGNGKPVTPFITWLDRWARKLPAPYIPHNIWIGTSTENQAMADKRIPELLRIPARVRFLSCEPLLGKIDLHLGERNGRHGPRIDWVIVGGESGKGARPFVVEHASNLVRQCRDAGVAAFVKQLGSFALTENANSYEWPETIELEPYGQAFASARIITQDKKGGDMAEWPEELRVREFPVNAGTVSGKVGEPVSGRTRA